MLCAGKQLRCINRSRCGACPRPMNEVYQVSVLVLCSDQTTIGPACLGTTQEVSPLRLVKVFLNATVLATLQHVAYICDHLQSEARYKVILGACQHPVKLVIDVVWWTGPVLNLTKPALMPSSLATSGHPAILLSTRALGGFLLLIVVFVVWWYLGVVLTARDGY